MRKPYLLIVFTVLLVALNIAVWHSILFPKPAVLEVSFLDVGQGDAILIETPSGVDVLIDGGPDRSVLRQLPKELGYFDRTIDFVIATHPDKDHIAGLPDVFDRYRVRYYFAPGVAGESSFAEALRESVEEEPGLQTFMPQRGMRLSLGEGVYADILFPDRDVSEVESNDASTALRLVYGETSFMFTGDLASKTETYIAALDGVALKSNVLKAGHHGSKSSTNEVWLAAVQPEFFVVSAGKGNSYGHPAPEVLERVRAVGATILSTIESGTVRLISDGKTIQTR
jgi:competence protein ComEC